MQPASQLALLDEPGGTALAEVVRERTGREHEVVPEQHPDDDDGFVDDDVPEGTVDFGFDYPDGFEPEFALEDVLAIQDGYLVSQLATLADKRASEASRVDAWDWLMVPLVTEKQAGSLAILSFQRCCYAYGADPAELQEKVIQIFTP